MSNVPAVFMPHGMCFSWQPSVLALHVVSDTLVALSYFCIPALLITFVRRRPALRRVGLFFSCFILSCGLTHAMDVWTIWHPDYWLSGGLKALTALASLGTVAALLPLMPYARALRRFSDLDRVNRELESQYRLIVETSNDGIWLTDSATRTTFVNARITEMLGFASHEMLGKPIAAFFDPAAPTAGGTVFALPDRAGSPVAGEARFLRKDGTSLWAKTNVRAILDADADVTGYIAMIADTTERHAAQDALADSERQYYLLADAMPHIVFVADAGGEGRFVNRAWFDFTGFTFDQTVADGWHWIVHPADAAHALEAWRSAVAGGHVYETELRLRRAADGMFRWFVSRATPVTDEGGTIVRWIGSCTDIHDFKVATETRSVLDMVGHIITIRDEHGALEYASPSLSNYLGIPVETGGAFRGRDFVHPDDLAGAIDLERTCIESPLRVGQAEFRLRAADGTYRWFLGRSVGLPKGSGSAQHRLFTLTDIDDLKRTQAAFGYSEMRYRALTDAMAQMVWVTDEAMHDEYVNERWKAYTGLPFEPDQPSRTSEIAHPDDLGALRGMHEALRELQSHEMEIRLRRADGSYRWHIVRSVPLGDHAHLGTKWIVTATDIEARKQAEAAVAQSAAELDHHAHHDPLTNLPNRTRLIEQVDRMVADGRQNGTDIAVLYLDLDHFKNVNDTLGHLAGDALLQRTAQRISSVLRNDDIVSRFGGDEFVLACAADVADAARIAERVAAAINEPVDLAGKRISVSASIGISMFQPDGPSAAELFQRADAAMYAAKDSGRNTWCVYGAHMQSHDQIVPVLELETELREAIALEQFVVEYQPIVDAQTARPLGGEALVRWNHPRRGMLPPGEFIAFAESHGLIASIGEIVLRSACEQLRRLELRPDEDFTIAVNVSAHQFKKPGFVAAIAAVIAAHGIEPRRLEIEITESIVMDDAPAVIRTLDALDALGVKLSLDDFGTGYSSLAYMKNFPIHTLKIDRSFVSDIDVNFTDQAIAKTTITLAHSLGMRVIAEGVETEAQLAMLRSFDADCIQGYLISRPLSAARFEAFLTAQRPAIDPTNGYDLAG